jgi:hypothetical protein
MSVVSVWEVEPLHEMLVPRHKAIGYCLAHQRTSAREGGVRKVSVILLDASEALVENLLGPAGADDTSVRDAHQEVAKLSRIQDACIVRMPLVSVPETVLLCFSREFIEHRSATSVIATLVRQDVGSKHSSMRANAPIWECLLLEQLHEIWARNI